MLVIFLVVAFVYAIRVIGPKAAPKDQVITRRQVVTFTVMILTLWLATDWPMHDIAEEYLYSVHMVQHLILSYIVPPLALLSTPEWLFRLIIGEGRSKRVVRFLCRPATAFIAYNSVLMVTHIPALVNLSASKGPLHYCLHVILVTTSLMMWMPIVSPIREWQMKPEAKMIYLFALGLLPTIPAGWLTVADGVVYKHYNTPVRVWGISVIEDQQGAGTIMKIAGNIYIWIVIGTIFTRRVMTGFYSKQSYVREPVPHDSEIVDSDAPLTFTDVQAAFDRVKPQEED
jgi:putative membrane protein